MTSEADTHTSQGVNDSVVEILPRISSADGGTLSKEIAESVTVGA